MDILYRLQILQNSHTDTPWNIIEYLRGSMWSMHPFKTSTSIHLFLNLQFNGGLLRLWRLCVGETRETVDLPHEETGRLPAGRLLPHGTGSKQHGHSQHWQAFRVRRSVVSKCLTVVEATSFLLNRAKKSQVVQWAMGPLHGIGLIALPRLELYILWLWQNKSQRFSDFSYTNSHPKNPEFFRIIQWLKSISSPLVGPIVTCIAWVVPPPSNSGNEGL